MNRTATASARHHTYLLISRLFLDGITEDLLPYIAEIPELAAVAPQPFDHDEAAAAHYQIFAHDIFPFESIFRDPSGLIGGIYADQVKTIYEQAGIRFTADYDHIGHELAFLAALCNAEANGMYGREIEAAGQIDRLQRTFLHDHLLCWLPSFAAALSFSDQTFYATLGHLTLSIVHDHFLSLSAKGSANSISCFDEESLLELPEILKDNRTSLKQIAGYIITPPHSGLYYGRSSISALANECQIPRGFGNRQQMLSNLFHTAAQYDLISDVLQDLSTHAGTWGQRYQEYMTDFPEISLWIRPWLQRVKSTAGALSEMRTLSIVTP